MAFLERQWRIVSACVLGAGILGATYLFVIAPAKSLDAARAEAAQTDAILKVVLTKDTDGDGLPDWREELYGTDPTNPHSVRSDMTDAEAVAAGLVASPYITAGKTATSTSAEGKDFGADIPTPAPAPQSLTEAFARTLFTEYVQANGAKAPDASAQSAIVTHLVAQFSQNTQGLLRTRYAPTSVRTRSDISVTSYASAVENIFMKDDAPPGNMDSLSLLQTAIEDNDVAALKRLAEIGSAYGAMARDLSVTDVPPALAEAHMKLLESLDLLSQAASVSSRITDDPLLVLAVLPIYVSAPKEMTEGIGIIARAVLAKGGTPAKGEPGAVLVQLAQIAHAL